MIIAAAVTAIPAIATVPAIAPISAIPVITIVRLQLAANRGADQATCNCTDDTACEAIIVALAFAGCAGNGWLCAIIMTV